MVTVLNEHVVLDTTDADAVCPQVAKFFWQHEIVASAGPAHVVHACTTVGQGTAIHYHTYGQDTAIRVFPRDDDNYTTDCYVLLRPLRGVITVRGESPVGPADILAINPDDEPLDLRWSADCAVLAMSVARSVVHPVVAGLAGLAIGAPLRFTRATASPGSSAWWDLVRWTAESRPSRAIAGHPLLTHNFERLLVTALVVDQAHTYTMELPEPAGTPSLIWDSAA